MKKTKLFDRGVFQEGFRHLKVPGILFLIVYSLPSIISFITTLVSRNKSTGTIGIIGEADIAYTVLSLSFFSILYILLLVLAAPVLTISAFRFLSKRNASDIYHSLPFRRETIFISLFTAVAAWLGIITLSNSLLSLIFGLIINSSSFVFSTWIIYTLARFISLLFVAACFSIAVTITGTLGSNIVVGFLITYLPRLIITNITQAIISSLPILTREHLGFFLNNQYNLVTSSYITNFITRGYGSLYEPSIYACIYTFVVSILYVVLACILFRRRKSENAGQAAPNRTLQAVYRIALCMVVCIFILTFLFDNITKGNAKSTYSALTLYIVAIAVYFAYELLTTKRFKNLLKALPGLGIVVVLNLAIYGIMAGARSYELNFAPAKEEISSVAVSMQNSNMTSSQYYGSYNYYADYQTIDIDLYDEEAISIVADSLKENVDALQDSRTEYNRKFTNYYAQNSTKSYLSTTVKIKTNLGTKYRKIYISFDDIAKLKNIYYNNNEYREMYKKLPKANSGSINVTIGSLDLNSKQLPEKTLVNIYEKVREEIAECYFEQLYDKLNTGFSSGVVLKYSYYDDHVYYSVRVPLRPDITPKAYELFLEKFYSESTENRNEIREFLKDYKGTYNVSIQFYKGGDANTFSSYNVLDKHVASVILNNEKEGAPKIGDTFVIITLRTYTNSDNSVPKQIETIINLGETELNNVSYT